MKLRLVIERYTVVRNGDHGWDAACEGVIVAASGMALDGVTAVNSCRFAFCAAWKAKRELKRKARGIIRGLK